MIGIILYTFFVDYFKLMENSKFEKHQWLGNFFKKYLISIWLSSDNSILFINNYWILDIEICILFLIFNSLSDNLIINNYYTTLEVEEFSSEHFIRS